MSQTKIENLIPEQEALIPVYREKWRQIALSSKPIDREKAAEAIKSAYIAIGYKQPRILFFDSPSAAIETIVHNSDLKRERGNKLGSQLRRHLDIQLWSQLKSQLDSQLANQLETQLMSQLLLELMSQVGRHLVSQLGNQLDSQNPVIFGQVSRWTLYDMLVKKLGHKYIHYFDPEGWACRGSLFDFCIAVLNCDRDQNRWEQFQLLAKECGWIFPYENTCLVCDRPIKLSFDSEHRLHAEGDFAIQFADGFSMYANHGQGVWLPKKYGKLHPKQWRSQWLLEEQNAEVKRVLIQGIGYERICQELQAIELDNWQEYVLLKINVDIDEAEIYLLKMTCPSTDHIHVLRVPPDLTSAREAIRWVNWGIDPEEFSVQT